MLPGGALAEALNGATRAVPRQPRAAWRVAEGVQLCRERYMPDGATGALAGVVQSNTKLPQKFADLCHAALQGLSRA